MESQAKGYWEKRQQILEELELTFLEPTDVGIRNALDQFWQSLQDLSKNPESEAARAVVPGEGVGPHRDGAQHLRPV